MELSDDTCIRAAAKWCTRASRSTVAFSAGTKKSRKIWCSDYLAWLKRFNRMSFNVIHGRTAMQKLQEGFPVRRSCQILYSLPAVQRDWLARPRNYGRHNPRVRNLRWYCIFYSWSFCACSWRYLTTLAAPSLVVTAIPSNWFRAFAGSMEKSSTLRLLLHLLYSSNPCYFVQ